MARRTRKQITEQRLRDWAYIVTHWYAGYRICRSCHRFRYCAGRSYERQRCKDCFVEGNTCKRKHHHHHKLAEVS